VGGVKNFARDPGLPHFTRIDGAWFDFAVTVRRQRGAPLLLLAYDFEIRMPDELSPPTFVRFDLNRPEHPNEYRGSRSHVHPGSDDFSVPFPLLSPAELLDVILHRVQLEDDRTAPRGRWACHQA
jgi:hypothetical protein